MLLDPLETYYHQYINPMSIPCPIREDRSKKTCKELYTEWKDNIKSHIEDLNRKLRDTLKFKFKLRKTIKFWLKVAKEKLVNVISMLGDM